MNEPSYGGWFWIVGVILCVVFFLYKIFEFAQDVKSDVDSAGDNKDYVYSKKPVPEIRVKARNGDHRVQYYLGYWLVKGLRGIECNLDERWRLIKSSAENGFGKAKSLYVEHVKEVNAQK